MLKNCRIFKHQLWRLYQVTRLCHVACSLTDLQAIQRSIQSAKASYATALRVVGRMSFTVDDVEAFEIATVRLEAAIKKLLKHRNDLIGLRQP